MYKLHDGDVLSGLWYGSTRKPVSKNTYSRWISATERHPKHGDIVLCALFDPIERWCEVLQWDDIAKGWISMYTDPNDRTALVTHWMPLPELPKEE